MSDKPKDMAKLLRELSTCAEKGVGIAAYPQWFQEEYRTNNNVFATYMRLAADELEGMQKLNGKLYKTLYPD
jgi:hypothetical protein